MYGLPSKWERPPTHRTHPPTHGKVDGLPHLEAAAAAGVVGSREGEHIVTRLLHHAVHLHACDGREDGAQQVLVASGRHSWGGGLGQAGGRGARTAVLGKAVSSATNRNPRPLLTRIQQVAGRQHGGLAHQRLLNLHPHLRSGGGAGRKLHNLRGAQGVCHGARIGHNQH